MTAAAEATQGKFYTLVNADDLLEDLPSGYRVSLAAPMPPIRLWNHWLVLRAGDVPADVGVDSAEAEAPAVGRVGRLAPF